MDPKNPPSLPSTLGNMMPGLKLANAAAGAVGAKVVKSILQTRRDVGEDTFDNALAHERALHGDVVKMPLPEDAGPQHLANGGQVGTYPKKPNPPVQPFGKHPGAKPC